MFRDTRMQGTFGLTIIAALALAHAARSETIYVDQSATGANNGQDWANAFLELQSALAEASPGDEIWVAEGNHRPDWEYVDPGEWQHSGNR